MKLSINSGKFWLKMAVFCLLAAILAVFVLSVSVYSVFSRERIEQAVKGRLKHGQSLVFDNNIDRSWFPRPTVTLKNVIFQEADTASPALRIRETDIGFAWRSLWSDSPIVEKWVMKDAQIETDGSGSLFSGNFSDITVNRIIVENGNLRVSGDYGRFGLSGIYFYLNSEDSDGRAFRLSAETRLFSEAVRWQGEGILQHRGAYWSVPLLDLNADGRWGKRDIHVKASSSLYWYPASSEFRAVSAAFRADSPDDNFHLTAQTPQLTVTSGRLDWNVLNGTLTVGDSDKQWDGSFKLEKARFNPKNASLDNFEFNGSYKNNRLQTSFNFNTPLVWEQEVGITASKLHLMTFQDIPDSSGSRFISSLDGEVKIGGMHNWQGKLKGLFDRQDAAITFKYEKKQDMAPKFEAGVALQKLNLEPYWRDFAFSSGGYPDFLTQDSFPETEIQLNIDNIYAPGLRLDNVQTLLSADRKHIALSRFKAGLYGGETEGGIGIANTVPLTYHIQQNAKGVQIRPLLQDLFGFHSFSGNGNALIDLIAKGSSRKDILSSLNGSLTLDISNGVWHGIDIDAILKNGLTGTQFSGGNLQTPFHRFTLNSHIDKGISHHNNTELVSDSLLIKSHGYTDLEKQTISEEMQIRNAKNPKARAIPIKINGPVSNPSVTIDYNRLTDGLNTSEEKRNALKNTLKEQWQWLNQSRQSPQK